MVPWRGPRTKLVLPATRQDYGPHGSLYFRYTLLSQAGDDYFAVLTWDVRQWDAHDPPLSSDLIVHALDDLLRLG